MRTCVSCGKANNPTRKFCLRCGKPLYPDKEIGKEVTRPVSKNGQGVNRAVKQLEEVVSPSRPLPQTPPKATTEDQWVRPSEVSKDRVRTTSPTTGKSEMEKAREAFAKAEEVGIIEENGDIVETRMLRASEVQELMESLSKQQETATPITQPGLTPVQTAQRTTVTSSPERSPEVRTPSLQASPTAPSPPPAKVQTFEEPRPTPRIEAQMHTQPTQEERMIPPPKIPVVESMPKSPASIDNVTVSHLKKPIPELDAIVSEITDPDFLQDQVIRETVNDLTNLHTEVRHYEADLRSTSNRLEKESKECWNKAEVKRIHFESLEEQLRLAKQEWTDSSKVFQNAEKLRKDEVASREKHLKDLQKRISKTEDSIRKRVKDLEKEKEKIEQQ